MPSSLVVEPANTSKAHTALARRYPAEAPEAGAKERPHEHMADAYNRRKVSLRWIEDRRQRERLSKRYAGVAKEYETPEKVHAEAAERTE